MDQIKSLVKDVLYKIQDIPDVPFTTVRMSDIPRSPGLTPVKKHSLTHKAQVGENNNDSSVLEHNLSVDKVSVKLERTVENMASLPEFNEEMHCTELSTLNKEYNNGETLNQHQEQKRSPPLTFVTVDEVPVQVLSELEQLNAWKSSDSIKSASSNRPVQPKMGRTALLRSRSISTATDDYCDVVRELVEEKHGQKLKIIKDKIKERKQFGWSESNNDDISSTYSTGSSKMNNEGSFDDNLDFQDDHTTAELNSTYTSYEPCDTSGVSTIPEFDPVNFVRNAIGNVTIDSEYSDSLLTDQFLTYSQSMSQIRRPSFLSSIKSGIRKTWSFSSNVHQMTKRNRQRCHSLSPRVTDSLESLENQLHVHSVQVCQASKAVDFCRNHLNEVTVPRYAEAEKVLLVASCYKDILSKTLHKNNEYDDTNLQCCTVCGIIEISNLMFHQKNKHHIDNKFDVYYVVIISCGVAVLSSDVLINKSDDDDKNENELKIAKTFVLNNLNNDFEISIAVYSLQVEKYDAIELKKKQNKKERKSTCPSTKSIFLSKFYKPKKKTLSMGDVSTMRTSLFKREGICNIRLSDLGKDKFKLNKESRTSSLRSEFGLAFKTNVEVTGIKKGILSIGEALKWNTRYCVLDGYLLKYWNYPEEEYTREPLGIIDLSNAAGRITLADRSLCSRPRCLSLQLCYNEGAILQYYFCFDSLEEKNEWMQDMNFVIGTLEDWNCLNKKQFLITSL
ncbi:anillin-like isoform X2 [Anthonomus grandis grandis]|uniref:anillin-like isoform X2 n=1 Tax=Anthonomus grandis grandis TaxID=2921223 RepID=UPI002164F0D8|nr:anillin-like isoform X2 [Anthonomus grandis grandis]